MANHWINTSQVPTAIAALGMVCALGYDVNNVCAAARAGLTRSSVLPNFRMRSAVEGDEEPVVGHVANLFTSGFEGAARLIRLAQGALQDLLRNGSALEWQARTTAFYLSFPDPERTRTGVALIADAEVARSLSEPTDGDDAELEPATQHPTMAAKRILERAAGLAGWPGQVSLAFLSLSGYSGGIEAMRAALGDLDAGRVEIAIVLGVDSLLDQDTLVWLHLCGRLKSDGVPAGLVPGEAAAAIALTAAGRAPTSISVPGNVIVQSLAGASEERNFLSGGLPTGESIATVIDLVWREAPQPHAWVISDHNGEVYRATDWGTALVRLRGNHEAFAAPTVWYPALSFGDTGAASTLAAVCVAVRALARRYAPSIAALVTSASDGAGRGACLLASN